MSVVLVTGGTGFLGARVARELASRGDEVHVLARSSSDRSALKDLPVHWHVGDLSDRVSLVSAASAVASRARLQKRRAVCVHSAALISYRSADREAQRSANVEGTRHVLEALIAQRFDRLLHVSSVVAVGRALGDETLDETASWNLRDAGCDYATTKRAAEELVLAAASALEVVIVNPGAIFGSVATSANTVRFMRAMARGRGPLVAPPGTISVLGIDDCALACVSALDRGARGARYLLVESSLTALELFRRIARALGARPPLAAVPHFLWPAVVAGAKVVDRVKPLELTPPQALVMLGSHLRFRADRARSELGWRPQPFDVVLARAVADLRERGLLDEAR